MFGFVNKTEAQKQPTQPLTQNFNSYLTISTTAGQLSPMK